MKVRFDSLMQPLPSTMFRDRNGYLHVKGATLARAGVIDYSDIGGPRELIPPGVLADPQSVASMIGAPIVDGHPPKAGAGSAALGLLTPETARLYQRGMVIAARIEGDYLVGDLVITDANLANDAEIGLKNQISTGARYDSIEKRGVWTDGESYSSEQVNRQYNHVAIVPRGRCSTTCGGAKCLCAVRHDSVEVSPMGMKQGKKLQRGVRLDAVNSDALMELCAKAYPDDVKAALAAYAAIMAEGDDADPPDEALDAPDAADKTNEKAAAANNMEMGARMDALTASVAEANARALAAEKALERQGKSAQEGLSRAIADHQAAADRARLAGVRLDSAQLSPSQMDQATLIALYPEDKDEILKYSPVETAAHIRQAFHAGHGDARIRGARANVGLDSFPEIVSPTVKNKWDAEIEADRVANGQGRRS